jgi:hypothetical protein
MQQFAEMVCGNAMHARPHRALPEAEKFFLRRFLVQGY